MKLSIFALAVGVTIVAGSSVIAQDGKVPSASRFEVASIKASPPNTVFDCKPPTCSTAFYMLLPGRFRATRMSVSELIGAAYSMPMNRIVAPEWTNAERFDVEATHGLAENDRAGVLALLQRLLQERLSLRLHREQRPMPVYVLKKARDDGKLGPELRSIPDCTGQPPTFLPAYVSCGSLGTSGATTRQGRGRWTNMALHTRLAPSIDRPVVDETGLDGWFELRLDWSDAIDGDKPSLFTAMREQLGLKLEAAERPMDVLVIDAIDRPTPD